jgi:hypothetical protein
MMEDFQSQKVVSIGGLNSNVNHIQLSDNEPLLSNSRILKPLSLGDIEDSLVILHFLYHPLKSIQQELKAVFLP